MCTNWRSFRLFRMLTSKPSAEDQILPATDLKPKPTKVPISKGIIKNVFYSEAVSSYFI